MKVASEILAKVELRVKIISINKAPFAGKAPIEACTKLSDAGKGAPASCRDTEILGRPMEPLPRLRGIAEQNTKLLAICVHTQRALSRRPTWGGLAGPGRET